MKCVRILVDVASERLCAEILELLERAGHEVERGALRPGKTFDVALVGSVDAASAWKRERLRGPVRGPLRSQPRASRLSER